MKVKFTQEDMNALDSAYYTLTKEFICNSTYDPREEGFHDAYQIRELWNKMCDRINKE